MDIISNLENRLGRDTKPYSIYYVAICKLFGYPDCCIEEFIYDFELGRKPIKNRDSLTFDKYNRSGFIPCNTCASRVIKNDTKLSDLIVDRLCNSKFPKDGSREGNVEIIKPGNSVRRHHPGPICCTCIVSPHFISARLTTGLCDNTCPCCQGHRRD